MGSTKMIELEWERFWRYVKPDLPALNQEAEMRLSFYSGAFCLFTMISDLNLALGKSKDPEGLARGFAILLKEEFDAWMTKEILSRIVD